MSDDQTQLRALVVGERFRVADEPGMVYIVMEQHGVRALVMACIDGWTIQPTMVWAGSEVVQRTAG